MRRLLYNGFMNANGLTIFLAGVLSIASSIPVRAEMHTAESMWKVSPVHTNAAPCLYSLHVELGDLNYEISVAETTCADRSRYIFLTESHSKWWGCLLLNTNGLFNFKGDVPYGVFGSKSEEIKGIMAKTNLNIMVQVKFHIRDNVLYARADLQGKRLFYVGESVQHKSPKDGNERTTAIRVLAIHRDGEHAGLSNGNGRGIIYDVASCITSNSDEEYSESGWIITPSGKWSRYSSKMNNEGIITTLEEEGKTHHYKWNPESSQQVLPSN